VSEDSGGIGKIDDRTSDGHGASQLGVETPIPGRGSRAYRPSACVAIFHKNHMHVLIESMDLSGDDLAQIAAADRRVVDPPVRVDVATWRMPGSSTGG
jgi:hypothetical protein